MSKEIEKTYLQVFPDEEAEETENPPPALELPFFMYKTGIEHLTVRVNEDLVVQLFSELALRPLSGFYTSKSLPHIRPAQCCLIGAMAVYLNKDKIADGVRMTVNDIRAMEKQYFGSSSYQQAYLQGLVVGWDMEAVAHATQDLKPFGERKAAHRGWTDGRNCRQKVETWIRQIQPQLSTNTHV